MKIKNIITLLLIAIILASCAPAVTSAPTKVVIPIATFNPTSTLPPTLTPMPTSTQVQVTPTEIYMPIQLSPADDEVYQKALSDIPLYRQGDIQINVQDEKGNPLSGYQVKYHQTTHDFLFGGIGNNFDTTKLMQAGLNSWSVQMSWYWIQPEYKKFDLDFTNYWLGIDELKTGDVKVRAQGFFAFAEGEFPPFYGNVPYDEFLSG
jgi:hypothetical protein